MKICCNCNGKVGILGYKLKGGSYVCAECAELYRKKKNSAQNIVISKLSEDDILQVLKAGSVDKESLVWLAKKIPPYIAELKHTLGYRAKYNWVFIGDSNFDSLVAEIAISFVSYGKDEIPIAFCDNTIFGNKKRGVLLTNKYIYYKDMMEMSLFDLSDTEMIAQMSHDYEDGRQYYIKWTSQCRSIELESAKTNKDAHSAVQFWGNLLSALLTKDLTITIIDDIEPFIVSIKDIEHSANTNQVVEWTPFQVKMLDLLLNHSFDEYKKREAPRADDWGYFSPTTRFVATDKRSLLSWNEYAMYTSDAVYYHNQKLRIHDILYYHEICDYNDNASIVLCTGNKEKCISEWDCTLKSFIKEIATIRKATSEYETSTLEYCFNNCSDFRYDLRFCMTDQIQNELSKQFTKCRCKELKENWKNIQITELQNRTVKLQFRPYFSKEDMQKESIDMELEQRIIETIHACLLNAKEEIAKAYQEALFNLYGCRFRKENIIYVEDCHIVYQEDTAIEKTTALVESAVSYASDYMERKKKDIQK